MPPRNPLIGPSYCQPVAERPQADGQRSVPNPPSSSSIPSMIANSAESTALGAAYSSETAITGVLGGCEWGRASTGMPTAQAGFDYQLGWPTSARVVGSSFSGLIARSEPRGGELA